MTTNVEKKWFDHRGTELQIGQEVAYNLSGEVAYGKIVDIKVSEQKYWNGIRIFPRIKIERIKPDFGAFEKKKFSVVTSSKNLLVLNCKSCEERTSV